MYMYMNIYIVHTCTCMHMYMYIHVGVVLSKLNTMHGQLNTCTSKFVHQPCPQALLHAQRGEPGDEASNLVHIVCSYTHGAGWCA